MKLVPPIAALIMLSAPAFAQTGGDMKSMPGMSAAPPAGPSAMTMADGSGVVTAVDPKAGTVTIHHRPIAKLNWRPMTMAFKANPPSLLEGVRAGQTVTFTLMQMDGVTTLTAIQRK